MTLREKIREIQCPADAHASSYVRALQDVLSLFDHHEYEKLCANEPNGDRRCREFLKARIDWNLKQTFDPGFAEALAIIEAIDVLTAAVRETKA